MTELYCKGCPYLHITGSRVEYCAHPEFWGKPEGEGYPDIEETNSPAPLWCPIRETPPNAAIATLQRFTSSLGAVTCTFKSVGDAFRTFIGEIKKHETGLDTDFE